MMWQIFTSYPSLDVLHKILIIYNFHIKYIMHMCVCVCSLYNINILFKYVHLCTLFIYSIVGHKQQDEFCKLQYYNINFRILHNNISNTYFVFLQIHTRLFDIFLIFYSNLVLCTNHYIYLKKRLDLWFNNKSFFSPFI